LVEASTYLVLECLPLTASDMDPSSKMGLGPYSIVVQEVSEHTELVGEAHEDQFDWELGTVDGLDGLAVADIEAAAVIEPALGAPVDVVLGLDDTHLGRFQVEDMLHLAVAVEEVVVACHLASQDLAKSWFACGPDSSVEEMWKTKS
jgi:hypothetical protein